MGIEIKEAFDPFYTATSLKEATDVNVLHDLKDALDDTHIYNDEDIEKFNELYFTNEDAEKLHPIIDEAVDRALVRSPQMAQQQQSVDNAFLNRRSAWASFLPTLSASSSGARIDTKILSTA